MSTVLNKRGILKREKDATNQYEHAKALEKLKLALDEALMKKYSKEGLTDKEQGELLNEIGKIDSEDNTKITVDGYEFEIDRENLEVIRPLGGTGTGVSISQ